MFVPTWILVGLGVILALFALTALIALLVLRRLGAGDMITQQRRALPPQPPTRRTGSADEARLMALPQVQAALEAGNKIEAIKLVREASGLGLREAKELVERHDQH